MNKVTEFKCLTPGILYKYTPFRESFFDAPILRFSPLNELNDPFELSLACIDFPDSIRQKVRESYSEPLGPNAERIILAKRFDDHVSNKNAEKNQAILSLTEDPEHILMWSHYADQHKGMVIGLDFSHDFFKQMFINGDEFLLPVKYCNQRPLYSYAEGRFLVEVKESLGTKGLQWGYEREWRAVTKAFCSKKKIKKQDGTEQGGFIDIPEECIKEIYLGTRRDENMVNVAQRFIKKNPHIKLYLGYKSVGVYELDFLDIDLALKIFPSSLL
ncbi:MAG: DUF2971 domain-containing protein [Desulfobulbus sp.]|nr:DUF2971 domain-containing protein [Desulfobulbus sp.]